MVYDVSDLITHVSEQEYNPTKLFQFDGIQYVFSTSNEHTILIAEESIKDIPMQFDRQTVKYKNSSGNLMEYKYVFVHAKNIICPYYVFHVMPRDNMDKKKLDVKYFNCVIEMPKKDVLRGRKSNSIKFKNCIFTKNGEILND